MERKIAFFVASWASDPSLFAWAWLKQTFLRRIQSQGKQNGFILSEKDKLYIVHVSKSGDDDNWDRGGPLLPHLSLALARYPHKVVVLESQSPLVPAQSLLAEWVERNSPDVLVFGIRERGKPHKVVEYFRQHSRVPFLIVQPENVRNDRLRLNSERDADEHHMCVSPTDKAQQLEVVPEANEDFITEEDDEDLPAYSVDEYPEGCTRPRKIAIAYETPMTGNLLLAWATKYLLQAEDAVFVVHCVASKEGPVRTLGKQAGALSKNVSAKMQALERVVTRSRTPKSMRDHPREEEISRVPEEVASPGPSTAEFDTDLLQGYNVVLNVRLKGDPKHMLSKFAAQSNIDLLLVGTSGRSMLKRALTVISTGGSVSRYLMIHAPCPVLLLPYKGHTPCNSFNDSTLTEETALEVGDSEDRQLQQFEDTMTSREALGQVDPDTQTAGATPSVPGLVEQLQQLLRDKEREIAVLQGEVAVLKSKLAIKDALYPVKSQ